MMVINCNCLDLLRTLPDNSIDSIVTDPPYGLGKEPDALQMLRDWMESGHHDVKGRGFMGKEWDAFVPQPVIWAECLRVLKPGGHLLAFAGTRTQDLMALGLRIAGFEIRDVIAWVYGSGFPKSMNVSKAIDAREEADTRMDLLPDEQKFCQWMRTDSGLDVATVARVLGSDRFVTGKVEIVNTATRDKPRMGRRAMVSTAAAWEKLRGYMIETPPDWVEKLVKEPPQPRGETPGDEGANEWQGWGTALKPAMEPITVARKPLAGTVADTVTKYGTGAINIDGCRVEGRERTEYGLQNSKRSAGNTYGQPSGPADFDSTAGRWPANLIQDGAADDLLGHAARFFYCPKASKSDRNYGCDSLPEATAAEMVDRTEGSDGMNSPRAGAGRTSGARNTHPTVKPIALMRYLCRLVTPPGGTVLDPFSGSGTTGVAAVWEGFNFIGAEMEEKSAEIANARIMFALLDPDRYIDGLDNKKGAD